MMHDYKAIFTAIESSVIASSTMPEAAFREELNTFKHIDIPNFAFITCHSI